MFLMLLAFVGFLLFMFLVAFSSGRAGNRVYLAWLDLASYLLTSASVVALIYATQGNITQAFRSSTGPDLDFGASREELQLLLDTLCGQEPECGKIAQSISVINTIRGPVKSPQRVNVDVGRIPVMATAISRYNAAFDQVVAQNRIMYLNAGFWVSLLVTCGILIGTVRRALVLLDAIRSNRHKTP